MMEALLVGYVKQATEQLKAHHVASYGTIFFARELTAIDRHATNLENLINRPRRKDISWYQETGQAVTHLFAAMGAVPSRAHDIYSYLAKDKLFGPLVVEGAQQGLASAEELIREKVPFFPRGYKLTIAQDKRTFGVTIASFRDMILGQIITDMQESLMISEDEAAEYMLSLETAIPAAQPRDTQVHAVYLLEQVERLINEYRLEVQPMPEPFMEREPIEEKNKEISLRRNAYGRPVEELLHFSTTLVRRRLTHFQRGGVLINRIKEVRKLKKSFNQLHDHLHERERNRDWYIDAGFRINDVFDNLQIGLYHVMTIYATRKTDGIFEGVANQFAGQLKKLDRKLTTYLPHLAPATRVQLPSYETISQTVELLRSTTLSALADEAEQVTSKGAEHYHPFFRRKKLTEKDFEPSISLRTAKRALCRTQELIYQSVAPYNR